MAINPSPQVQGKGNQPNKGKAPSDGIPRRLPPQAGGPRRAPQQTPAMGMVTRGGSKALRNFLLAGGVTGGTVGLGLWIF